MSTFWARRRAAVAAEAEAEAQVARTEDRAAAEAELAARDDADILAELNLPDPETLGPGDDFKAFLTDAVPARLRSRALRRLWTSNPVLANVDGLVDYGGDFTDAALAVESLQTAYQVGKGMAAHVQALARQAEQEERGAGGPEAQPLAEAGAGTAEVEAEATAGEVAGDATDAAPQSETVAPSPAPEAAPTEASEGMPVPRRMRFSFAADGQDTGQDI